MQRRFLLSIRLLLAAVLAAASTAAAKLEGTSADKYIEHVKVLAAPEMKGRGAGSPELEHAGEYIAKQFERLGLESAIGGKYLQPFSITTGGKMGDDNRLVVRTPDGETSLQRGRDYVPVNFSSSGSISGQVVFAGYGASADEHGYDDYTHFDVKDKIVLLLRYEPKFFSKKGPSGGQRLSHHAHLIAKAINARDRGAKAVILVNGKLDEGKKDQLLKFGAVAGPDDAGTLMVHVKNDVADQWLRQADTSLAKLHEAITSSKSPQSLTLPSEMTITLDIDIEREKATVHNVVGFLPGRSDEYVVIGAHYDHLGLGDHSSLAPSKIGSVHHGADDNASGVAGLIELARVLSRHRETLERGVLFIAFTGEEIGLLGSSHWVNDPTLPLDKAVTMINMDMIGRIRDNKVYVGGTGTDSTFKELLGKIEPNHDFEVSFSEGGYTASDHTSFVTKKVPVLFFFSGLHSDYHKPSDTAEKINAKAATELLDMIGDITTELIAADAKPEFRKVTAASHGGGSPGRGGEGGYGPYFGSIPDFGPVESGVKFADIRPGSPADKAGLRGGDILTQFGDKEIKNLYDFTYALRAATVGDVVEVTVERDGQEVSAKVTLEQRQ